MKKTGNEVRIPLSTVFNGKGLAISREIKRPRGPLFKLRNNQHANRVLKAIAKEIGIKRNVTFHTARHYDLSFPLKINRLQKITS